MEIDTQKILKRLKVIKRNTLFPLEYEPKYLNDKRCPYCAVKLKLTLKGMYICPKKPAHKPSFACKAIKL